MLRNMSRCRGFRSLDECVNPEYHDSWGCAVTVKDAINDAIEVIERKALQRYSHIGYMNVFLPDFNGKPKILEHIFFSLSAKFHGFDIKLQIGDKKYYEWDMVVQFTPFTPEKGQYAIPVGWNDDLPQWTWQDVCRYGHYPTSSSQVWPPEEYKAKARMEAERMAMKNLEQQRQQVLREKHEQYLKR